MDGGVDSFFFNDTATTEIYTLSLHDALPISFAYVPWIKGRGDVITESLSGHPEHGFVPFDPLRAPNSLEARKAVHRLARDRKSTRLNSSHANISYAVFCLKKKKTHRAYSPST